MSKTIIEIKKTLKEKLLDGINAVLEALLAEIPANGAKYNEVLQIKSRHKKYKSDWLSALISQDQANLEFNRLNAFLLDFIDHLEIADFDAAKESTLTDERIGKLCFRIPGVMLINEKSECKVWVSLDEETLLKLVEVKLGDELRDLRVSDTMGVELFDDSDQDAFKIKTYDETIQPIEKGLLTQWAFRVTPLKEGTFPLVLRIIVVVEQNGKELKKTIVLQEEVEIVTEATEALAEAKEISGKTAQNMALIPFSVNQGVSGGAGTNNSPNSTTVNGMLSAKKIIFGVALGLAALFLFWNLGGNRDSSSPPVTTSICQDEDHWRQISQSGNLELISDFLVQCPETSFTRETELLLKKWKDSLTTLTLDASGFPTNGSSLAIPEPKAVVDAGKPVTPEKPKAIETTSVSEVAEKEAEPTPSVTMKPAPKDVVTYINASRKPLHPDCKRKKKKRWESCTEDRIKETVRKYIKQSKEGLKGSIKISFIITKEGLLAFPTIEKTDNEELAPVILKGLKELPRFEPGQNSIGEFIDVKYILPVRFE
ncbi:MAG: hypothetical protein ACI9XB_003836 [Gammaproteobacteria bacterium]|jgi:hypothetical protein